MCDADVYSIAKADADADADVIFIRTADADADADIRYISTIERCLWGESRDPPWESPPHCRCVARVAVTRSWSVLVPDLTGGFFGRDLDR